MKNSFWVTLALAVAVMVGQAFTSAFVQEAWDVPDKYENMENPVKASSDVMSMGKSLYVKHCQSCHGKEGWGDGPKAAQLETPSGDFSSEDFQSQSDGAIFYKTLEGRGDMPSFKKKIPYEEDIWSIVHYVRTFK
ncbi:MAG: cytochrome c [Saprospiraceae bacterium]|nr:cytochrome c [Saprospiraceae bacterium]